MITSHQATIARIISSAALAIPLAIAPCTLEAAQARGNSSRSAPATANQSLMAIQFQAPGDGTPTDTTGGGTRGVQFQSGGDATPADTTGGGTRGEIRFASPSGDAPNSTTGGGTRDGVRFTAPGDSSPGNTTGGGTRDGVTFAAPGDASPSTTTGGGTRDVNFQAPGEDSPKSTVGGGTRTDALSVFIPLLPATKLGRTVAARPTFFVYVPEGTRKQIFFSLQTTDRKPHYQTTFEISGKQGILSFTLPADAPELEVGKDYLWFFAVIEPGQVLQPGNYGVNGWVKRVPAPVARETNKQLTAVKEAELYAESGIWYDTLAVLAAARRSQPENQTLVSEWNSLLKQVGLDRLTAIPLVEQF
ncbi:MAG TPA: DUF928 domain-containing protein [Kamptonema sp.]|nr:DUF928 domain-containing protein [Kamptonema sp.]